MQKFIIKVDYEDESLFNNFGGDCYLLKDTLSEEYACRLIIEVQKRDIPVLFYGDNAISCAKHFQADGVVLDLGAIGVKEELSLVRKQLKEGSVVGLFSRLKRHEAMLVSEAEPDFVIFKIYQDGFQNAKELIDWYSEFFLLPCAGYLMENITEDDLASLRCDFIIK